MSDLPSSAEVVIVGAGIMGCSLAWHLAQRGQKDVVVLERDFIGRGSTADAAGGIRLQFSSRANIELSKISMEYWENFEERFGAFINFRQQGYLFLLTSEENVETFERNMHLQQSLGVPVQWVPPKDIAVLNPAVNLDGVIGGTFCPRDGWADTSASTMGFASAARALGVRIFEETSVTGIQQAGDRVTGVQCDDHTISASTVVICAGPQSGALGRLAGWDIPIEPVRRMSWVTGPFDALPPSLPFTIEFEKSLYFHPESGGFLFGMSDPDEPISSNKTVDQDWLLKTVEALVHRAPAFAEAPVRNGWAGFYEVSPDDNALIGKLPGVENGYIAAGFSGHGFMQGPAVGLVMSELLLDGSARSVDLSEFSPARFAAGHLHREHNVV